MPDQHDEYQLMPEDAPFEHGFNMKTVWGALFVGFVMLPGAIYLGLVTGQSMAGGAEWVTIILFIEIAKRTFVKLKTQEIIILYWVAGGLVQMGGKLGSGANLFGGPFGGLIWDQYLVQSPQAEGLADYIPTWVVPPKWSDALDMRSFIHVAWIKPIIILVVVMTFSRVCSLSMGYVLFRVTNDIERLPFPMARVFAGGATALAETSAKEEGWRWRVFSIGSFIGAMYGLIYIVVPALSGIFLTDTVTILPIPFVDFTPSIKAILPATSLGLNTNIGQVLAGFVIPFWIVVGTFSASMVKTLFVNQTLYKIGILHSWSPGMSTIPTEISNSIDFWLSFSIGPALVVAFLGFGLAASAFLRGRARAWEEGEAAEAEAKAEVAEGRGDISIWIALAFWFVGTLAFVLLVYYLVPDFPWWICAIFGFLWTPLFSYVCARMIGLTGSPQGVNFPYVREGSFYLSGYVGAEVWFAPIPMYNHGGMVQTFKQLELTRTKFGSLVWLSALTLVVMLVCSFIFWSMVWKMGPIPSSAYPYVQKMWPFHATMQALWAKSTIPEQLPLADFEGGDNVKMKTIGMSSKNVPKIIEATEDRPYATREVHFLRAKFEAGRPVTGLRFYDFQSGVNDWTGYKWIELDVYNPSGGSAEALFRLGDANSNPDQPDTLFEKKVLIEPGKNIFAVQLVKPGEKVKFEKQLPRRNTKNANIVEIQNSEFKAGSGRQLEIEKMSFIEFIMRSPGTDHELYLDNLTLIGEPRSFIAKIINWRYIVVGFGIGWLLYTVLTVLDAPPLLFYGCISGMNAWPHYTILLFIGAMLGRFVFQKRFGANKWRAYAPILLAGYACGFSLIGMTSIAIVLIHKSISQVVF